MTIETFTDWLDKEMRSQGFACYLSVGGQRFKNKKI